MRPSLRPVAGAFVAFGLFWGTWAVAAADIEVALELSHGGLGLLLSVALGGAALANAMGGAVAERRGAGPVLALALAGWGVLLIAGALVRHPVALAAVVVAAVAAGGLVDVVMNVSAVAALAARPGSLVRFHAVFNAGAAIGAASAAVLLAQRLSWRWAWAAVGVGALILAPVCGRARLPASEPGEHAPLAGALRLIRREGLVLLSLAFAVGAIVEAGIELWGVLFMRSHLGSGLLVGGVSAVAAYLVGATTRVVVGPVAGRRGAARGVTVGAGTAALGTSLLALAPVDWLAGARAGDRSRRHLPLLAPDPGPCRCGQRTAGSGRRGGDGGRLPRIRGRPRSGRLALGRGRPPGRVAAARRGRRLRRRRPGGGSAARPRKGRTALAATPPHW
jgi:hypothetical protein